MHRCLAESDRINEEEYQFQVKYLGRRTGGHRFLDGLPDLSTISHPSPNKDRMTYPAGVTKERNWGGKTCSCGV